MIEKLGIGLVAAVILLSSGCVTIGPTRPNQSLLESTGAQVPSQLRSIARHHRVLAHELGKLPEIRDGLNSDEDRGLTNLARFVDRNPELAIAVFERMNRIGLPRVRPYCAPLQAVLWLAGQGPPAEIEDLFADYSLKKLLDKAWIFERKHVLTVDQLKQVLDGYRNRAELDSYRELLSKKDYATAERFFLMDLKRNQDWFGATAQNLLARALGSKRAPEWRDFDQVMDRLNSPELIDYYERRRISYDYVGGHGDGFEEAKYVFANNKGHCAQITAFTLYALLRSGYKAERIIDHNPALTSIKGNPHRAVYFEADGRKYVMDNGRDQPRGILPYQEWKSTAW